MATQECRIEFYFKIDQLKALIESNPKAKGIIVSQRIEQRKQANGRTFNVALITARVDKKTKTRAPKKGRLSATAPGDGFIDGCPFPPGCTV